nr:S8/S53 family peptidase [Propionicimonas sp.]
MNRRTRLTRVALALGLGLVWAGTLGPAPEAVSAGTIRTQPYTEVVGLDVLRERGLDGTGVTIAIIDGPPEVSVPELRGADVTVKDYCKEPASREHVAHGTAVTSLLASPDYGWAPKARYLVYNMPLQQWEQLNSKCRKSRAFNLEYLVNQALTDGADVITTSVDGVPPSGYSLTRAAMLGVPVIAGAGNGNRNRLLLGRANLITAVGATDLSGKRAPFSSYGAGLTVMAPGTNVTTRGYGSGGRLSRIEKNAKGTSFAAPMVAGALALARQKWPDADGNQLLNALLATARRPSSEWNPTTGWGTLDAVALIDTDPSGLSHENPLADKGEPDRSPTLAEQADYRDGLTDPSLLVNDDGYIYRGEDQIICMQYPDRCQLGTSPRLQLASPEPTATPSPVATEPPAEPSASSDASPMLVGAGVVGVLAVLGVAFWFLRRRGGS